MATSMHDALPREGFSEGLVSTTPVAVVVEERRRLPLPPRAGRRNYPITQGEAPF